jgi:dTDP-4-amino-4,6-dideoxygalactose transaminase
VAPDPHNAPEELVRRLRFPEPIYVSRPTLPSLEAYREKLEPVWRSAWLTNDGDLQRELETRLTEQLGIEQLSLCCNGTVALLIALQACGINSGEVITTPFTFPATPHALYWNRVQPVFCDIDERNFNLDPAKIEERIGPKTRAILPVHVFGSPCDVEAIQAIADRHGLPVIYDAAHAMGVSWRGRSVLEWGAVSVLSFHATKLFTTGEGGAIVSHSSEQRERIRFFRNFGIVDEETVMGPGINGKLSELHAALGLLQLDQLDAEIAHRKVLTDTYREHLRDVPGLSFREDLPEVGHNYAYFVVRIDRAAYGVERDRLHDQLRAFNVHARKYFHPLCSHHPPYDSLPSAAPENLPIAEKIATEVLCLPLYGTLANDAVERIAGIVKALQEAA